jgi:hypothetical protein
MKKLAVVLISLVVYCLAAVPAHADSVPKCRPDMVIGSIPSGACESGDLLYSNFQFNNPFNSLDSSPGVSVLQILATPTPFGVIFSTSYGINGGFTNCLFPGYTVEAGSVCIGGDTTIGYDVSVIKGSQQIAGIVLFGGSGASVTGDGVATTNLGGGVYEVGCLGAGNTADVPQIGFLNQSISTICTNPSSFALSSFGSSLSGALFSPVSNLSVAIDIDIATAENGPGVPGYTIDNISPFANAFLLATPEPSTWIYVLGAGLVTLVMKWKTLFH